MVRFLLKQDVEIFSMGVRSYAEDEKPHGILRHCQVDITNAAHIEAVLRSIQPDAIFHLAGVVRSPDPQEFYRVNTQYAAALFTALEQSNLCIPTLVVGTAAEVGTPTPEQLPICEDMPPKPLEHYGISKLAQTHIALAAWQRRQQPVVVARPSNIIGVGMPNHFVVQNFVRQIAAILRGVQEPVVRTGNLESARDFIPVEIVVEAFWQLLHLPSAFGEVVNVCSGSATPIAEVLSTLIMLAGQPIRHELDPALYRSVDVPVHYGSVAKFERLVGWKPSFSLHSVLQHLLTTSMKAL